LIARSEFEPERNETLPRNPRNFFLPRGLVIESV